MKDIFMDKTKKELIEDFESEHWGISEQTKAMLMQLEIGQLTKKIEEWELLAENSKMQY